jgi:hypothetical protein
VKLLLPVKPPLCFCPELRQQQSQPWGWLFVFQPRIPERKGARDRSRACGTRRAT